MLFFFFKVVVFRIWTLGKSRRFPALAAVSVLLAGLVGGAFGAAIVKLAQMSPS